MTDEQYTPSEVLQSNDRDIFPGGGNMWKETVVSISPDSAVGKARVSRFWNTCAEMNGQLKFLKADEVGEIPETNRFSGAHHVFTFKKAVPHQFMGGTIDPEDQNFVRRNANGEGAVEKYAAEGFMPDGVVLIYEANAGNGYTHGKEIIVPSTLLQRHFNDYYSKSQTGGRYRDMLQLGEDSWPMRLVHNLDKAKAALHAQMAADLGKWLQTEHGATMSTENARTLVQGLFMSWLYSDRSYNCPQIWRHDIGKLYKDQVVQLVKERFGYEITMDTDEWYFHTHRGTAPGGRIYVKGYDDYTDPENIKALMAKVDAAVQSVVDEIGYECEAWGVDEDDEDEYENEE